MNKKMLKIVIIAVVVIDLLLVGFVLLKKKADQSVVDKGGMEFIPEIKAVTYYVGGGELGGYYRLNLKDYVLSVSSLEGNGAEEISNDYEVANEVYMDIANIIDEYKLKELGELPPAEIMILDADTRSLDIDMFDGTSIRLGDDYEMDDKTKEAMKMIVNALEETIDENNN